MKIIKGAVIAAALITAGTAAREYIKNRAKKQEHSMTLGIDWKYIYLNNGVIDGLKKLKTEVKFGLQRFVKGYDYSMFMNFCDFMDLLIIEDLHYMIKYRKGSPPLDYDGTGTIIPADEIDDNHERFTKILKDMLYHFEKSRDDNISETEQNKHHKKALEMLIKYYKYLWD